MTIKRVNIKNLFWDFDGVLLNSNEVRDLGFLRVLKDFNPKDVEQLMTFHRANGGLSRYVKFRFFFEEVLGQTVSNEFIAEYAERFSVVMREFLTNKDLQIRETLDFIRQNHGKYRMFVVSGSDQNELRWLCKQHGIDTLFESIHGSPTPKTHLLKELIANNSFIKEECLMVGDSKNDFDAAVENGVLFLGFNNPDVEKLTNVRFSIS